MASVSVTRTVNAPLDQLWNSWDDLAAMADFNPNLSRSYMVGNSAPTGMGAVRHCDLSDGRNYLKERVIGYEKHRRLVIDIFETSMPMKDAKGIFEFRALGPTRSEVTFTMEFTPPMGLFGKLMLPMMRPQMRKLLAKVVDGNKAYVERGETVQRAAA